MLYIYLFILLTATIVMVTYQNYHRINDFTPQSLLCFQKRLSVRGDPCFRVKHLRQLLAIVPFCEVLYENYKKIIKSLKHITIKISLHL